MEREFVDSREGFDGDYDGYEEWLDCHQDLSECNKKLFAQNGELLIKIDKLHQALIKCRDLACGEYHTFLSDRCDSIRIYVDEIMKGEKEWPS